MYTTEELEKQAREIHGDKYQYDWTTYTKKTNKMRIICPIHGEFNQSLHGHINKKQGCKYCTYQNNSKNKKHFTKRYKKLRFNEFVDICNEKFNYKYQYINVDNTYKNLSSNVNIICPIHGEITQVASSHLNSKYGCKYCANMSVSENQMLTTEEFIKRAHKTHGDKYNYSKVKYIDCQTPVTIICPIHGEFDQIPYNHLTGYGCKYCGHDKTNDSLKIDIEEFIKRARKVHDDKYDYSKTNYINSKTEICITCKEHGDFYQRADKHLQGDGCPKCANQLSNAENEIYEFCCDYLGKENVVQRERNIIKPLELDIYLPTLHTAIEYNGLRWHSEKFGKDRQYHLNKLNECKKYNIQLLQIFEDEYINNRDIVYNKIKHILKLDENLPKIMGRKCVIKEINDKQAKKFLNTYHIQGYVGSRVYLGAFYNDELIAVMTFKKETKDGSRWELMRFASNYNYICQGIGGKLFKYFIKNYNPEVIKSFADRRWTINEENNVYLQLGFKFDSYTEPDYHYFKESDGIIRQHKFNFRKNRLSKKYGLPLSMTETEMIEKLEYTKIYDCGLIKYVWSR